MVCRLVWGRMLLEIRGDDGGLIFVEGDGVLEIVHLVAQRTWWGLVGLNVQIHVHNKPPW